jgi:excisionase family DNA binding protein
MNRLLTAREAAELLRLSVCTVYRYAQLGWIPQIRKGFGLRFRQEDLDKWINQDKQKPFCVIPSVPKIRGTPRIYISGETKLTARSKSRNRHNFSFGAVYTRTTRDGIPRWYLDYRNSAGKRIQRVISHATSREEALLALQEEVRREFDSEYRAQREHKKIVFRSLAATYLEDYAKANKKSWRDDKYRIDANLNPYFGEYELEDITPLLIEKYRTERLKTGVSRSTVNREITIAKKMFNLAIDWNLTDCNPAAKVRLFSEKDTQKERILKREEEERLLAACPGHLRPIVVVALHTGMRRGEILGLKWKQIDLDRGQIRVENTKSGKKRLIPINDVLRREFEALRASEGPSGLVFANPRTRCAFTEVKNSFKTACQTAGINGLRFHDLRHSFATRLIEAGVDIITVKELLGHFSVRVTERYTHPSQEQKRRAVEALSPTRELQDSKGERLLHICDTAKYATQTRPVKDSLSIN